MSKGTKAWLSKHCPTLYYYSLIWIPVVCYVLFLLTRTALANGVITFHWTHSAPGQTAVSPLSAALSESYYFVSGGVTYPVPPIPPVSFPLMQPLSAALAEIGNHRVEVNFENRYQYTYTTSGEQYTNTETEVVTMLQQYFADGYDGDYILVKQDLPKLAIGSFVYHDSSRSDDPKDLNAAMYFVRLQTADRREAILYDDPEYQTYMDSVSSAIVTDTERAVWKSGYLPNTSRPARDADWTFEHPQLQDFRITVPAGWAVEAKEDWSVDSDHFFNNDGTPCGKDCIGIRLSRGAIGLDMTFQKSYTYDYQIDRRIRCSAQPLEFQENNTWYGFMAGDSSRFTQQVLTDVTAAQTAVFRTTSQWPASSPISDTWVPLADSDYSLCFIDAPRPIKGTAPRLDSFFYWSMQEPQAYGVATPEQIADLNSIAASIQGLVAWDGSIDSPSSIFPLPVYRPDPAISDYVSEQGSSRVLSLPGFSATYEPGWELKAAGLTNLNPSDYPPYGEARTKLNWVKGDVTLAIDLVSGYGMGGQMVACSDTATVRDITTDWKRVGSDIGYYYTIDGKLDIDTRLTDYWGIPTYQGGEWQGTVYSNDWSYLTNQRYDYCDIWNPIPLKSSEGLSYMTRPFVIGDPDTATLKQIDEIVKSITGLYFQN